MTAVRFRIETTFDLTSCRGIVAPGQLLSGAVRGGMTLRTEDTDQPVRILAVEFRCSAAPADRTDGVTLTIDRADAPVIGKGTVLLGPA